MIETYFNNLMQEVERKMGIESSRMEGEQVIRTCQEMVSFLRERSRELKDYVLNHPFSNVEEEICFFIKPYWYCRYGFSFGICQP